jgi:hypothetical protein
MNNEELEPQSRRNPEPGNQRERNFVTLASIVSAISLAWILGASWVGFRDGVLIELSACASRAELLNTRVEQYYRERDPWIERIKLLERQREQLTERLQAAADRIRDLELGKRP